jgi:TPR repeat protein
MYAQHRFGETYENGEFDLAIDLEVALMWSQKAAAGGDIYAQRRLGEAYENGEFDLAINLKVPSHPIHANTTMCFAMN